MSFIENYHLDTIKKTLSWQRQENNVSLVIPFFPLLDDIRHIPRLHTRHIYRTLNLAMICGNKLRKCRNVIVDIFI